MRRAVSTVIIGVAVSMVVTLSMTTTASAASPAATTAQPAKAKAKTVVKYFTPFRKDGRLRLPINESVSGQYLDKYTCGQAWVASAAGVYGCNPRIVDYLPACWVDPATTAGGGRTGICMKNVGDRSVIRTQVIDQPLPATKKHTPFQPWQIVLDNGARCDAVAGFPFFDPPTGLEYSYSCDNGWYLLRKEATGTFSKSTGNVLAQKTASPYAKVYKMHAKKVVYAGAGPKGVKKAKSGSACVSAKVLTKALSGKDRVVDFRSCVGKWVATGVLHEGNEELGMFHHTKSGWVRVKREVACAIPGPLPASLYRYCLAN